VACRRSTAPLAASAAAVRRAGAVGNLATEDLVYLLDGLGIEHGVSLEAVMAASRSSSRPSATRCSPTWLAGGRPVTRPLPGTDGDRAV
jgi:hydroxymethylglutaryl-CoA lyase